MKNRYVYSVLRFCPNPASGEFINIGAIVGSDDSGEWELRTVGNQKRARQIDENGVFDKALSIINDTARGIDEYSDSVDELLPAGDKINEKWLWRFFEDSQNIIQLSPPTPMIADNFDDAMQRVFDELIIDPAKIKSTLTKQNAYSYARRAYHSHSINFGKSLIEKAVLHTENYWGHLDFTVANGKAVQLTHAWSFQIKDQYDLSEHIKSWAWTVHDLRRNGATILTKDRSVEVPDNVEIGVVCIPPKPDQDERVFSEAKVAFREINANIFEVGKDFSFVDRAADLLKR